MSSLVVRAADLAARAHADQRRKGPLDIPYFNHCSAVASLVANVTEDPEVLAAALLHDVVEDSDITLEDIASLFSAKVASLVSAVTDDPSISDLPMFQRKGMQAKKMAAMASDAKLIKIADQTCNVNDLVEQPPGWPPDRLKAYLHGAQIVVDACRGVSSELEAIFDSTAQRVAAEV